MIKEDSTIRYYILNQGELVLERYVQIVSLKQDHPELWVISQYTLEVFICLCLEEWIRQIQHDQWNVGTFDVINSI